jgi:hypothetical protein
MDKLEPAGVEPAISVTVRASGVRPYSAPHMGDTLFSPFYHCVLPLHHGTLDC